MVALEERAVSYERGAPLGGRGSAGGGVGELAADVKNVFPPRMMVAMLAVSVCAIARSECVCHCLQRVCVPLLAVSVCAIARSECVCGNAGGMWRAVQGYLAHKKPPSPRTLQ